jgi:predicted permease
VWTALLTLALPLGLGALAARTRLLEGPTGGGDPIGALNRFALLVAFPALIVAAWLDPTRRMRLDHGLALVTLLGLAAGLGASWLLGGRGVAGARLPARGALALVALFGNTAYLGLPLVAAVLGPEAMGSASFVVALQVTLSVTLGSYLLARWSGREARGPALVRKLASSPLAWSPVAGAALAQARDAAGLAEHPAAVAMHTALDAVGRTASPLGLFVLGLFLAAPAPHEAREGVGTSAEVLSRAARLAGDAAFAAVRLVAVPLATLAASALCVRAGLLTRDGARLAVLLAAVPAAISTFAMAHEAGVEPARVARAIVTTTLLSLATLPLFLWLAGEV